MLNYTYQEYVEQNVALVKSMVIKYSQFADKINDSLITQFGKDAVDYFNPYTWKYYLNISGQYHPTDTVMYIKSLDTLETIEFNNANLINNPFTYQNYYIGSSYYYRLLAAYPGQETIIRGMLNPINIDKAIAAVDGTILGYDNTLVNKQEITLIQELNDYLVTYYNRYKIVGYYHTDSLEPVSFFAIMILNTVSKLINLRLKRAKTPEANDYHIYYYLESHSQLGQYICYLTTEQKLWLYRNILYLEKHAGLQINLNDLIDNLVTKSFINISEYNAAEKFSFGADLLPDYTLYKTSINNKVNVPTKLEYSIADYSNFIQDPIIGGTDIADYPINSYYQEDFEIQTAKYAENESKVLELSGVDYTDSYPIRYKEVLLYTWMNLVKFNKYTAYIYFKEPRSGNLLTITSEDALIFMFYLISKYLGIQLDTVQPLFASRVLRFPKATVSQLTNQVPASFTRASAVATDLVSKTDVIRIVNSIADFNKYATGIYNEHVRQFFVVSNEQDLYNRGYTEAMVDALYAWEWVNFDADGTSMTTWLASKGLTDPGYSQAESFSYAMEIFNAATGFDQNACDTYNGIKQAVTSILRAVSSYSVQIINDNQNSTLFQVDWSVLRASRVSNKVKGYNYIEEGVEVIDAKSTIKSHHSLDLSQLAAISYFNKKKQTISLNLTNQVIVSNKVKIKNHIPVHDMGVMNYISQGNYDSLTAEQQKILFQLF